MATWGRFLRCRSPQAAASAYEILAALGRGGMGEVYRTRDHGSGDQAAAARSPGDDRAPHRASTSLGDRGPLGPRARDDLRLLSVLVRPEFPLAHPGIGAGSPSLSAR